MNDILVEFAILIIILIVFYAYYGGFKKIHIPINKILYRKELIKKLATHWKNE